MSFELAVVVLLVLVPLITSLIVFPREIKRSKPQHAQYPPYGY